MMNNQAILYISNILPAQSETFVYREIFAIRECGTKVFTASVHKPEDNLGSPELDSLAGSAIPVYSAGWPRLIMDAALEGICHPIRTLRVLSLAALDVVRGADIHGFRRIKIIIQAFSSLSLARRVHHLGIIHIHAHMAHVPTTIAMYTAKQLGIGFSFTGHANDLFPNRSLLKEKIERSLFVSCISQWHRDFYASIFPKDLRRLPVIHCGVDTTKEVIEPAVHDEVLRVLSVGRLVSKKGLDILVEAARLIAQRGNVKVELIIAGAGPEEEHLRAQITSLPMSARVTMVGKIDNKRVMELMTWCEVFALPLRVTPEGDRDGIPVVLMEAMARGRCVISGDLATIRELVEHGSSGYLIPTGDVDSLVRIIEELAIDRDRLDVFGKRGRERIVTEFDVNTNAHALLNEMREVGIMV
jgi:glycosyltransferase involved in cell wall biosynthesis